jgi:hypothetical protein
VAEDPAMRDPADDEFQSWNRWRDEEDEANWAAPEEAEPASQEGDAEQDEPQSEVEPPPATDEESGESPDGYSPRRSRGGRHRVKSRGWSKAPKQVGPRRAALKQRRKDKAKTISARSAGALVLVAVLVAGAIWWISRPDDEPNGGTNRARTGAVGDVLTTTLVVGSADRGERAVWMALLSYDNRTDEGSVVYIPAHTAVEVPGRGMQGVGDALVGGDDELLMLSATSLLNIDIDHFLELTPEDAQAWLTAVGPLTVDVPGEVRVPAGGGTARLLFSEGPQEVSPQRMVELLYTVGLEGNDTELGPRHLAFWDAMFDTFADNPSGLAAAIAQAGDVGTSDARFSTHAALLQSLAAAGTQQLTLSVLPVEPVAAGDSELYSVDPEELADFLEEVVHASPPEHEETRVQILNGNGVPGIGQEVATELGEGFQVVLTGNYRTLDQARTLIISYDSSPEGLERANQARELIGVGEVQISRQEQSSVDLSIIVGKDFLRRR